LDTAPIALYVDLMTKVDDQSAISAQCDPWRSAKDDGLQELWQ
jgi:hypothetical protein